MVRVYTRTGDKGETALFDGSRVAKSDLRVDAYGTVDELNSCLSLARLAVRDPQVAAAVREEQRFLFVVGADLATPRDRGGASKAAGAVRRVAEADVARLESLIDAYWARIEALDTFVVPGETTAGAHFHVARCVCRRAERLVTALVAADGLDRVGAEVLGYLNRLSDLLFTWGRFADEGAAPADRISGLSDG